MKKLILTTFTTLIVFASFSLNAQESNPLPQYPWLVNLVTTNTCTTEKVEVFESSIYSYVLVTDANGVETLYNSEGQFYCQNAPNYDCITAYRLNGPSLSWECGIEDCSEADPFSLPAIQTAINTPPRTNADGSICWYIKQIIQFQFQGKTFYRIVEDANPSQQCVVEWGTRFYTCEGELIGGTGIYLACDDVALCIYDIPTLDEIARSSGGIIWNSDIRPNPSTSCTITITNTECRLIGVYDENDQLLTTMRSGPFHNSPPNRPASTWEDTRPLAANDTRTYVFKENILILGRQTVSCNNTNITVVSNQSSGCTDALGLYRLTNTGCRTVQVNNTNGEVIRTAVPDEIFELTTGRDIYIFLADNDTLSVNRDGEIDSGGCIGNINDAIFDDYPWLTNVLNPTNCSTAKITVYQQSIYNYLLVTNDAGDSKLYNQDGLFYCQQSATYDCVATYNLGAPIDSWTCENNGGCACPTDLPGVVCGTDGKTYDNSCTAACAGVQVAFEGPCDPVITGCRISITNKECRFVSVYDENDVLLTSMQPGPCGICPDRTPSVWEDTRSLSAGATRTYIFKENGFILGRQTANCTNPQITVVSNQSDACGDILRSGRINNIGCENIEVFSTSGSQIETIAPKASINLDFDFNIYIFKVGTDTLEVLSFFPSSGSSFDLNSGGCLGSTSNNAIPENFKEYDVIYRICKGESLTIQNPSRTVQCPNAPGCGMIAPCEPNVFKQFPEWTGGEEITIGQSLVTFSPIQTTVYSANFSARNCNPNLSVPSGPTYTYLVIVEDTPACQTSAQTKFEITACIGDLITLPLPSHDTLCSGIIGNNSVGSIENQAQNYATLRVAAGGTFSSFLGRGSVPTIIGDNIFDLISLETSCPLITYEYTVRLKSDCEGPPPNPVIFKDYPWLTDLINPDNCTIGRVEIYQAGIYKFLRVDTGEGFPKLYNQNGLFYCQESENYNCVAAYNLGAPIDNWTCQPNAGVSCTSVIVELQNDQLVIQEDPLSFHAITPEVSGFINVSFTNNDNSGGGYVDTQCTGQTCSLPISLPAGGTEVVTYTVAFNLQDGTGCNYTVETPTTGVCDYLSTVLFDPCDPNVKEIALYEFRGRQYVVTVPATNSEIQDLEITAVDCETGALFCAQGELASGNPDVIQCGVFLSEATKVQVVVNRERDCPCPNTGTIFFQNCDNGQLYYFLRTEDGTIYDPYFNADITYEPVDGEQISFDFVDATFPSPCSIAEKAITITCLQVIEDNDNTILEEIEISEVQCIAEGNFMIFISTRFPIIEMVNSVPNYRFYSEPGSPFVFDTKLSRFGGATLAFDASIGEEIVILIEDPTNPSIRTRVVRTIPDCENSVFEKYPFLDGEIDLFGCNAIEIFDQGSYDFVFLRLGPNRGRLYLDNGTFYCESTATYDCLSAYGLGVPTNDYGCSNLGSSESEDRTTTSFAQLDFSAFPNPTTGQLTLQLPTSSSSDYQLYIHDMLGHIVYQKEVDQKVTSIELDMTNYENGVYYIEVRTAGIRGIQRVVKHGLE